MLLSSKKGIGPIWSVFVTTDDGSYGIKGNVSVVINELENQFDAVYSCGAPGMMKYINQRFYDHLRAHLSLESRMYLREGPAMPAFCALDSETGQPTRL